MLFPVCREENFGSHYKLHRKRGRSARASPSPHHTLAQERTARFTARPFPALRQLLTPGRVRINYALRDAQNACVRTKA